jgi:hypothetical protein
LGGDNFSVGTVEKLKYQELPPRPFSQAARRGELKEFYFSSRFLLSRKWVRGNYLRKKS